MGKGARWALWAFEPALTGSRMVPCLLKMVRAAPFKVYWDCITSRSSSVSTFLLCLLFTLSLCLTTDYPTTPTLVLQHALREILHRLPYSQIG